MTTPSLRVYPFYICPAARLGLVSYQNHIKSIYGPYMGQGSPTLQKLDFGLCARVFSAVLTHIEPTIVFSHSPAVSHSKPRDFRFHEPAILFSYCSAVSHSKTRNFRLYEPTVPFLDCSAVSHSKTRDFRFHEPTIPFSNSPAVFLSKTRDFRFHDVTSGHVTSP